MSRDNLCYKCKDKFKDAVIIKEFGACDNCGYVEQLWMCNWKRKTLK